jgi:hypothetical protein
MTIQEFITKAIEGGWKLPNPFPTGELFYETPPGSPFQIRAMPHYSELLDPEAWKAVGKVEGWGRTLRLSYEGYCFDPEGNTHGEVDDAYEIDEATYHMHRLIDHLASGGSIESFFESL